jgi:hypothetical protein
MEKIGCIMLIFKENQRPSRYIERQRPCKKKGIFAQWVIFRLFAWGFLTCLMDNGQTVIKAVTREIARIEAQPIRRPF